MKKALFLIILIARCFLALPQSFYCKTIGIEEGLSQSSVTSVAYDSESSLWIGTRYGLNEFRGNNVRTFMDGGKGSLAGSYIQFLHVDSESQLWVSTDRGLSRFSSSSDSFQFCSPDVAYVALDLSDSLVFGTNRGLLLHMKGSRDFERIADVESAYVIGIHRHADSLIVVDRGLGVFSGFMQNPLDIPQIRGKVIMDSVLDGDILYLATFHEGLFAVDLRDRSVREFNMSNSGLTFDVILSILSVEGKLWLGTDGGGICVLDPSTDLISSFTDYYRHHTGLLPDNSVTTLYRDPHGNVWVGSVRNGLFGLKEASVKSLAARGPGSLHSLSHNVVISLHEDPDGIIWIGTDGGGINRYDPVSGNVSMIGGLKDEKVVSISDFDADRLLVSLYSRGYWLLDKRTGRRTPFVIVDGKTNADECYNGNSPASFQISETRNLIFAIHVYIFDRLSSRFTILDWDQSYPVSGMTVVGDDGMGKVYTYSTVGLFEVDVDAMYVKLLKSVEGVNTASFIDGLLWYGTDAGLFSLNVMTGESTPMSTSLFSRVTQICRDSEKALWIAADNTLFRYRSGKFKQFGENEGFAPNEILSSMASSDGGKMYLGGTKGLVEINVEDRVSERPEKRLKLHGIAVKGRPVDAKKGSVLEVPHDFSTISVSVNLSGSDPFEKVMYRYVVNGSNSSVVETYEDNIQLHSLQAGPYRIDASYMMEDGSWSEPVEIVSFEVLAPWYRSSVFYWIIIVLGFLALAVSFIYIYKVNVRKIRENLSSMDPVFVNRLDQYIGDNLSNADLDVSAMAADFAMSRAGLYNKVKATTGRAVAEYIMEKRMAAAKAFLKDSDLSITEISEKVGFASPKYFSTRFKDLNGCSPNAFRRQSRGSGAKNQ